MRLLDRYLLRELLIPLAFCLGAFQIFYCSFDLVFKLHSFQEKKMTFLDCVTYYVDISPELLVSIIIPVALLLSLLYAVTNHARNNEFTAMRAAGIGLWRISLPYLVVGAVCTVTVFVVNEFWVPDVADKVDELFQRRLVGKTQKQLLISNLTFRNESDNRDWHIRTYNPQTGEMKTPNIICNFPNGARREIYAQSGVYTNGTWRFFNVEEWDFASAKDFPAAPKTNAVLELHFSETPDLIRSELKVNQLNLKQAAKRSLLSIEEIYNYLELHPKLSPARRAVLMTQFESRIAEPFKCLVVVLIALPFGARSGRRNVFVGVAASIFICFTYFILQNVCLTLGISNHLSPLIAAWLPNAVFGITGIILTTRVR